MLEVKNTPLKDALLIKPHVFEDERGHFLESFNRSAWEEAGLPTDYVQDNQSLSGSAVLRGFHFQAPPHAQAKVVRVARGRALDAIVDIRKGSPTFMESFTVELSGSNFQQLYVPEGFAHAFLTIENDTLFQYKCSRLYNRASEGGIRWNDPDLSIQWGVERPEVYEKDAALPLLNEFKTPFVYGR